MSWKRNTFNRRFAKAINSEDAYQSGYFYIYFFNQSKALNNIKLVWDKLFGGIASEGGDSAAANKKGSDLKDFKLLSATCTAVSSLPGGTLNKSTITALGGTKWGAISGVDYGDTTSLRFIELANLPASKFISAWVNLIRDRNTGLSRLNTPDGGPTANYGKNEFSVDMCYFTTKPNGKEIEFAAIMEGLYPLKDPMDLYAHDLSAVDSLQIDIDFHVDSIWWDNKAMTKAQEVLSNHADGYLEYYKHQI